MFDANDGGVGDLFGVPIVQEIVINFARAKNHALRSCPAGPDLGRPENFRETAAREFFRARGRVLGAQQTLRRHDDERLDEIALHLPPQDVKILRGRGEIADLDVVLGAGLQKSLEPRAGMFRPLPFVTVRQEQDDAARPLPF